MSMQRIGLALLLATSLVALSYGAQAQASSGTGMDDEMTHGSMSKSQNKASAKGAQENTFHVNVTDPNGKPLSDANVKLTLVSRPCRRWAWVKCGRPLI